MVRLCIFACLDCHQNLKRKETMAGNNGEYRIASEYLLTEILSRLQVKSLLRFRCVCKRWYFFMKSSTFINKHANHYKNLPRLVVQHYHFSTQNYAFALFPDQNLSKFPPLYYDLDELQMPYFPEAVVGPFAGLFCLYSRYIKERMALWNPATREFKSLSVPHPDLPSYIGSFMHNFGFGLNPKINTCKIIWIRFYYDEENDNPYHPKVISVYTQNTDSWRIFEAHLDLNRSIRNSLGNTYKNGYYYWLTSSNFADHKILSFDMSNETLEEIAGPPDNPELTWGDLTMYNECISVVFSDPQAVEKYFDIWVMEEGGVWVNQLKIGPLLEIQRILGMWKNAELMLESKTADLVLYDHNNKEIRKLGPRGYKFCLKILLYQESLLSVDQGKQRQEEGNSSDMIQVQDFFAFGLPLPDSTPG